MRQIRPARLALFLIAFGEIASLAWLGKTLGVLGTLGVLLIAAVLGVALIRRSGLGLMRLVSAGRPSAEAVSSEAAGSLLAGMAGLLLFMPGLVSDVIAVLLLLPVTRTRVARLFQFEAVIIRPQPGRPPVGDVIDAEAVEIIEPDHRLK